VEDLRYNEIGWLGRHLPLGVGSRRSFCQIQADVVDEASWVPGKHFGWHRDFHEDLICQSDLVGRRILMLSHDSAASLRFTLKCGAFLVSGQKVSCECLDSQLSIRGRGRWVEFGVVQGDLVDVCDGSKGLRIGEVALEI
jgi:hypothetical protein